MPLRMISFVVGAMILFAGALTLTAPSFSLVSFIGVIIGVLMISYSYVYAEFQDQEKYKGEIK